jgi:hypothetical protein
VSVAWILPCLFYIVLVNDFQIDDTLNLPVMKEVYIDRFRKKSGIRNRNQEESRISWMTCLSELSNILSTFNLVVHVIYGVPNSWFLIFTVTEISSSYYVYQSIYLIYLLTFWIRCDILQVTIKFSKLNFFSVKTRENYILKNLFLTCYIYLIICRLMKKKNLLMLNWIQMMKIK